MMLGSQPGVPRSDSGVSAVAGGGGGNGAPLRDRGTEGPHGAGVPIGGVSIGGGSLLGGGSPYWEGRRRRSPS